MQCYRIENLNDDQSYFVFTALSHLLTKKQRKVLTKTLNQLGNGLRNTSNVASLFKKMLFYVFN